MVLLSYRLIEYINRYNLTIFCTEIWMRKVDFWVWKLKMLLINLKALKRSPSGMKNTISHIHIWKIPHKSTFPVKISRLENSRKFFFDFCFAKYVCGATIYYLQITMCAANLVCQDRGGAWKNSAVLAVGAVLCSRKVFRCAALLFLTRRHWVHSSLNVSVQSVTGQIGAFGVLNNGL